MRQREDCFSPQVVKCGYGVHRSTQGRFLKFDVAECDRVQVRESLLWRRNCVVIGKDADIGSIVERPRNTAQLVNGDRNDLNEEEELRQDCCTQKLDVTNCVTRPPLRREPCEIKLVDCLTDVLTLLDVLFLSRTRHSRRLKDDRANSESDGACCPYRTAERKEQNSPSHESSRELAMSGRDAQQNSTTPVPLLVVAIAHANGDEEPFILGACSAFFDSNCSTTGACALSLWSLCRSSDCYFC